MAANNGGAVHLRTSSKEKCYRFELALSGGKPFVICKESNIFGPADERIVFVALATPDGLRAADKWLSGVIKCEDVHECTGE